jgi:hypothetical protein
MLITLHNLTFDLNRSLSGYLAMELKSILLSVVAILASLVATVAVGAAPTDPSRVAMVFPPWWSAARAFKAAAAAGEIIGEGGVPFVVIVHRDPKAAAKRARSIGALFVLGADPRSLCSSAPLEARP